MISTNQSTISRWIRPMRVFYSANRRGDTPIIFALKEGKTDIVKILANNPQVNLDDVDEDSQHLEDIAR